MLEEFNRNGKTALITGSSRGLGAGIALALAEAGANVAIHGSHKALEATPQMFSKIGANQFSVVGDVGDASVCSRLIEHLIDHFGAIDILVNDAGTIRRVPAADHSEEDWQAVINTNLTSVFLLTRHAGKHMLARGSGKVIVVASVLTFQGGILVPSYTAAKVGVGQLTKAFAHEWVLKGGNVNAIASGYMSRDNTAAVRADPERSRQNVERIPAGRWGCRRRSVGRNRISCVPRPRLWHGHVLVVDGGWLSR
jgi:2-deoxy-D-gluconate 3-dehydrogenase